MAEIFVSVPFDKLFMFIKTPTSIPVGLGPGETPDFLRLIYTIPGDILLEEIVAPFYPYEFSMDLIFGEQIFFCPNTTSHYGHFTINSWLSNQQTNTAELLPQRIFSFPATLPEGRKLSVIHLSKGDKICITVRNITNITADFEIHHEIPRAFEIFFMHLVECSAALSSFDGVVEPHQFVGDRTRRRKIFFEAYADQHLDEDEINSEFMITEFENEKNIRRSLSKVKVNLTNS